MSTLKIMTFIVVKDSLTSLDVGLQEKNAIFAANKAVPFQMNFLSFVGITFGHAFWLSLGPIWGPVWGPKKATR